MSNEEEKIYVQYIETFYDNQNHRVEVNQRRRRTSIHNISAMQSTEIQIRNPIFQAREAGAKLLWNDYFVPNFVYPPFNFSRRFRMNRGLFN